MSIVGVFPACRGYSEREELANKWIESAEKTITECFDAQAERFKMESVK